MAKGGKRPGAGRKPGATNKKKQADLEKMASEGIMPLEYMLQELRNVKNDPMVRHAAAVAAAPYCHAKVAAKQEVELSGDVAHRIIFETVYEKRPEGKGKP